jgi:DNA-binding MarR family transcriptional regulator
MATRKTLPPPRVRAAAPRLPPEPELLPEAVPAWLAVVRTFHQCDAVMAPRLAALGLRVGEHEILVNLLLEPGLTQQQLAQRCFSAKSGVSMLATRLEQAGLLARGADAVDARVWRLSLTAAGLALAKRSHAVQLQVIAAMVAGSSAGELATIRDAMQRAASALAQLARDDEAAV